MTRSTEHGFSLIEVLISVFVLAVGVIGAAGMQLTALRTTQQSAFQTHALYLASDTADMMRANVEHMRQEDDANAYLQVDYQSSSTTHHQSDRQCYGAENHCDATQLAHFDIAELLQRMDTDLPGGRIRICRDALSWNAAARRFEWDCTSGSNSDALAPLVIKIGWQEKNQDAKQLEYQEAAVPRIVLTVAGYSR